MLRAVMPEDAGAARAFVSAQLAGTRYRARTLEQLDCALQFDDPEYVALLAEGDDDRVLAGLALFGTVAGARSVVKLHAILAPRHETAVALLDGVRAASEQSGERMIVCELPDDVPFAAAAEALQASGYVEEGRVPDFVTDGVAMRLLVRPLYGD